MLFTGYDKVLGAEFAAKNLEASFATMEEQREFEGELDAYMYDALATAKETSYAPEYLMPGLAAEAGEVNGKWAKIVRDKYGFESDEDVEEILKELGDVLWFIAVAAHYFGSSLSEVANKNLAKLASRAERGVIEGSGDNR